MLTTLSLSQKVMRPKQNKILNLILISILNSLGFEIHKSKIKTLESSIFFFTCKIATSLRSWLSCFVGNLILSITLIATSLPVFLCFPIFEKSIEKKEEANWQLTCNTKALSESSPQTEIYMNLLLCFFSLAHFVLSPSLTFNHEK